MFWFHKFPFLSLAYLIRSVLKCTFFEILESEHFVLRAFDADKSLVANAGLHFT